MITPNRELQDWQPVPDGMLPGISRRRRRRRIQSFAAATGGCLLLAALGLGVWSLMPAESGEGFTFGGMTCREVQTAMPAFAAGTLPPEQATKVRTHLELCPLCSRHFRPNGAKSPAVSSFIRTDGDSKWEPDPNRIEVAWQSAD